ncbi:MAG: hypothetical protein E6G65_01030 [Actinobacteria bacterium]|nr:MAG: hypothetical protein E6G65_01030 [Actinomycetota bacterium]
MRRMTDGSPHTRLTLAVDVLAIAAFVLIGMRSHSDAAAVSIFLLRAVWVRSWSAGEVLTFALVALVFATMLIGLGRAISAVLGARLFDRRAS